MVRRLRQARPGANADDLPPTPGAGDGGERLQGLEMRLRSDGTISAPGRRIPALAVVPTRDGDPGVAISLPSEGGPASEILDCAEALGVPWRRLLLSEIEAEQRLRRYILDVEVEWSLTAAMPVLSAALLRSWRVRDRIENLVCQARAASARGATRQLRLVFQRLAGRPDGDQEAFAQHLWFAYQRVLLLRRACRAAAKSRGTDAERLASVCQRTRCSYDDAAWALLRCEAVARRGHRLEAAVRKVREEGFLIPRAESEARAFEQLRRIVRGSPFLAPRASRRGPRHSACAHEPAPEPR